MAKAKKQTTKASSSRSGSRSGSRTTSGNRGGVQSALNQRGGAAPQSGTQGGWTPTQKALGAGAAVGAVALLTMFLWPSDAQAGGLPGGTQNPQLPTRSTSQGGGGGGNNSANNGQGGGGTVVNPSERNLTADAIRGIQRTLRGLGYGTAPYNVTCSGALDAATRSAINAFQGAYGRDAARHLEWQPRSLTADGVVGPNTQRAITHYEAYHDSGTC